MKIMVSQRRDAEIDSVDPSLLKIFTDRLHEVAVVKNDPLSTLSTLVSFNPDAIVLSGGNDIGSCPERDATERILLDYAREKGLRVLGICRGMQFMLKEDGGLILPISGHVRTRHEITEEGDVVGGPVREVNSFHHFAVLDCPESYSVLYRSHDLAIEAVRHRFLPWIGCMWHPEREANLHPEDEAMLERWLKS